MEPIKRFFAGASFLVFGFALHAANPAYESFKGTNGQVVTTPGIGAARVVIISGELFQPGSTNLTNWANLPTNVVSGANIWTQSGGTAFPTSAGAIVATNVQSWDKLIAKGAFIAETRSRTLVAGTNTLAVLTNSYLLLDSPTNDASSVVVQIGSAASLGQLLFVVNNQTNRAFTIYDGSVSGSGIVELQGNFVSTNLGGLILMNQGNWVEVGRFSPTGLSVAATINPTDGFIPVRGNSTTFTNSVLLQTNAHQVTALGAVLAESFNLTNRYSLTNDNPVEGHVRFVNRNAPGAQLTIAGNAGAFMTVGVAGTTSNALITAIRGLDLVHNAYQWNFRDDGFNASFLPGLSNAQHLGSATLPFLDIYLGTNSLYLGTNVYTDGGSDLLRNGVAVGGGAPPPPPSPTTSLRAYVDPIYGSDGSGEIGDILKPYLTITNAVLAANAIGANGTNVIVVLAPHTNYNIGNVQALVLTNNVSILGAGRYASVILGGGKGTTNSPIVQPGDNSFIKSLSIINTAVVDPDDIGEATIGFKSTSYNQDATNVLVIDCFLSSGSDGVYISTTGRVEITFIDCEMVGMWDVVATIGNTAFDHVLNFYNCDMKSDQRNRYGTNGAPSQVIFADNGIVNVYGGIITLVATNGAQHSTIRARASNGTINMAGGTRFEVDIPGSDLILRNDGGGVITAQNAIELNQIQGAVVWNTTNIVANSITASGVLTLNATNEVIIATGGGQGGIVVSNSLPRIKLQRTDGASAGYFRSLALGQFEIEIENTALSMNWNTNGLTYIEMMSMANMSTNVAFKIKTSSANGPFDVLNVLTNSSILFGGVTAANAAIGKTNGHLLVMGGDARFGGGSTNGLYIINGGTRSARVGGTINVNTTPVVSAGTSQTNLVVYTVPANTLTNLGDRLRFRAAGNFAANANTKALKVVYGGGTVLDTGSQIVNSGAWTIEGEIIRAAGTDVQEVSAEFHGAGVTLFNTANSARLTENNSLDNILAVASTSAGSGDVTNRTLVVNYFPAP